MPLLGRHPHATDLARVAEKFALLPPLPRRIKAFANLLVRLEDHVQACQSKITNTGHPDPDRWLKLVLFTTYLYHFHQEVYRVLWADRDLEFYRLKLLPWCQGKRPSVESDVFHGLQLPASPDAVSAKVRDQDETQLTAPASLAPVFGDPAADNVFRAQEIVRALGNLTETEWALCLPP